MKAKKCWDCGSKMSKFTDFIEEGIEYEYFKCDKCGREILTMDQLHEVAKKYKELRKAYRVIVSKWGTALAMRIPKDIVEAQNIKPREKLLVVPERSGFKVIPE